MNEIQSEYSLWNSLNFAPKLARQSAHILSLSNESFRQFFRFHAIYNRRFRNFSSRFTNYSRFHNTNTRFKIEGFENCFSSSCVLQLFFCTGSPRPQKFTSDFMATYSTNLQVQNYFNNRPQIYSKTLSFVKDHNLPKNGTILYIS
jgi:hypothetical protein